MSTIRLTATRDVDRAADAVWAVVADYDNDPAWRRGVVTMAPSPAGPVQAGTTTSEDIRFAGRRYRNDGRVTSVGPGLAFAWETTAGTRARGSRRVEPLDGDRSRVVLTLEVEPTGVEALSAPVLRRLLARQLRGDASRLVDLVEREQHTTGTGHRRP